MASLGRSTRSNVHEPGHRVTSRSVESGEADHDGDDILAEIRRLCWCGIFTRQSREPNDVYSSCQAQFDACLEFVKSRFDDGWVFNGRRYEDEAKSSESLERPGLQQLMEDIREGKVDRVVVHRLDRLSRRLADCSRFLQELHDRGVPLTIVKQPELGTTAEHTLLLNLMASFGEFEQEMTRERMSDARGALKQQGRRVAGVVPYAYQADPVTKQLVVLPQEARRVRKMFQMAADGTTPKEMAQVANKRGWRTKQRTSRNGRVSGGGRWTARQVLAILSNPVYAGLIRAGDQLRPGAHEPIVDQELFDKVHSIIASRRTSSLGGRTSSVGWTLRGLLRCGQCGRPMSPSISGHKNIHYRYYRCRSDAGGKPPCRGVSVPAYEIERYVSGLLARPETWGPSDAANGEQDQGREFAVAWSTLDERVRQRLLPDVLREVVFDAARGTITVSFATSPVETLEDCIRFDASTGKQQSE